MIRNGSGYPDPTANSVMAKGWEKERAKRTLQVVEGILQRYGFIPQEIKFVSERTGKTYRRNGGGNE